MEFADCEEEELGRGAPTHVFRIKDTDPLRRLPTHFWKATVLRDRRRNDMANGIRDRGRIVGMAAPASGNVGPKALKI